MPDVQVNVTKAGLVVSSADRPGWLVLTPEEARRLGKLLFERADDGDKARLWRMPRAVHTLDSKGYPLCRFTELEPVKWPSSQSYDGARDMPPTCPVCVRKLAELRGEIKYVVGVK